MKAIGKASIEDEHGVYPCMAWDNNYKELELAELKKIVCEEEAQKDAGPCHQICRQGDPAVRHTRLWKPLSITSIPCTPEPARRFLSAPSTTVQTRAPEGQAGHGEP